MQWVYHGADMRVVLGIFLRQPISDRLHLGFCLLQTHPGFHPSDDFEEMVAPICCFIGWKGEWNPNLVSPLSDCRQPDRVRQHAYDHIALPVQNDRASNDSLVTSKAPLPKAFIQNSNFSSGLIFRGNKRAPNNRP